MNILIPMAEGFEEIEAITVIDVFRRAGINTISVGLPGTMVTGAHGIKVFADKRLDEVNIDDFDALVLVGGDPGYHNLGKSQKIIEAIKRFEAAKKPVGAICTAPAILGKLGLLDERRATIYPGMEREIPRPRGNRVIDDDNIITSQGPGTAMEFAIQIVDKLKGPSIAGKVRRELVA
ncbi:MAG: DJ-1 family glyoxalase III [Candidatus Aenigmatarchaeota archaeon]